jgi:folate-binding protein YgfZ
MTLATRPEPASTAGACALAAPVLCRLDEMGVIGARGEDAAKFLQGQLSNDVLEIGTAYQLNGYCTAKGRLIATFRQWRDAEAICLALPREILAPVLKRLAMFVLRSKAKLTDDSVGWTQAGLVGPQAGTVLAQAGLPVPQSPWQSAVAGGVRVARLPDAAVTGERYMILAAGDAALPALAADPGPASLWWWSEVESAVPTVWAATQEKFVPQMINLEVLGGVNFRKGCYPGQEVVARSQYLGKLRRRMALARIATEAPAAGADIWAEGETEPVGTVVMASASPLGGSALLFEAPVDRLEQSLHAGSADGPRLALQPLPYAFFDPTA